MHTKILYKAVNTNDFEIVERKGIGHPDTLADMIADEFSNQYSIFTLNKFGVVLNHWVDKIVLSGGVCELDYGKVNITKPITVYLLGKVTQSIKGESIPVEDIFIKSANKIFYKVFGYKNNIIKNLIYVIDINHGKGKDHTDDFYLPKSINLKDILKNEQAISNDTVFCSGYAPLTHTEILTIDLENYINSRLFKRKYFRTGYDVKVLITKISDFLDITICIPFLALLTPNQNVYRNDLTLINASINNFLLKRGYNPKKFVIAINTKDRGQFAYLVAFGSALDKGDFGAVGRGNRYNGVISALQANNIEAVSGKNPLCHSGKLYTIFAHDISIKLYKIFGIPIEIFISAKNGDPINKPSNVVVVFKNEVNDKPENIKTCLEIIHVDLNKINNLYTKIVRQDVVKNHIRREPLLN